MPNDETHDWHREIEITKLDDEQRIAFGWFSVALDKSGNPVVDTQDDVIFPEDLEKAAYDHVLHARAADAMHDGRTIGRLVESIVFTAEKQRALGIPDGVLPVGWWGGVKVDDPSVWSRVKNGELRAFSIGGRGRRERMEASA